MTITHDLLKSVVWVSIERVRTILGWSHEQMSDHLHLTQKDYFQLRTSRKDVPVHSILLLADELKLDAESLSFGRLDYQAFDRHHKGDLLYLPERYSVGAFSRVRASIPIIDYSDIHFGKHFTDTLLRKLQINREVFNSPDQEISILFPMDACDYFVKMRHPNTVFYQIGIHFSSVNQNSDFGKLLRKCDSVRDTYEVFINQGPQCFGRNYSYRLLKLTNTSCLIEADEQEEALQALHVQHLGNTHICMIRAGFGAAIPTFLDLPLASAIETHCVHKGDSHCRLAINFEYAFAVHKKKSKPPHSTHSS